VKSKLFAGLIVAAIAVACIGTACGAKNSSAPGDTSSAGSAAPSAAPDPQSGGARTMKSVNITDPILDMTAYTMKIPADWIFQGAVVQGTGCVPGAFPVWRMSSPDGLTGEKQLPRLDWAFSDNPNARPMATTGCMDFKNELPASDVLKYMIGVLQVEYVKDMPAPALPTIRKNMAAQDIPAISHTVDIANAMVRYHINNIEIQDQISVFVGCQAFHGGGSFNGQHFCSAQVSRYWAPNGKWSLDTFNFGPNAFAIDQQWNAKWVALADQKIDQAAQASGQIIRQMGDDAQRQRDAQQSAFIQAQDMRQQQHEQFLSTMQRGTEISMKEAAASANANHRAAQDWADYSLDQQKRLDPHTGKITKDSSAYSYTWVNESGKRIQTNDINENPNGNGTGKWTLQQNIH